MKSKEEIDITEVWKCAVRDVSPEWYKAARLAQEGVEAFFPYVSSCQLASAIPDHVPIQLYTRFDAEVFASGASSFSVVKRLFARPGLRLFGLAELHAKILLVDRRFVSVGSQNLTVRGTKNLEATLFSDGLHNATEVYESTANWKSKAFEVNSDMLAAMEAALPYLRKLYAAFLKEAHKCNEQVQFHREEARRRREKIAKEKARVEQLQTEASTAYVLKRRELLHAIDDFCPDGRVSEEFAKEFIEYSAWTKNSWGHGPRPAEGAARNVFHVPGLGWCWNCGANINRHKLAVSFAILECKRIIGDICDDSTYIETHPYGEILERLKNAVWSCVADSNHQWNKDWYRCEDNCLMFGYHKINLCDFVQRILEYLPVKEVYERWKYLVSVM